MQKWLSMSLKEKPSWKRKGAGGERPEHLRCSRADVARQDSKTDTRKWRNGGHRGREEMTELGQTPQGILDLAANLPCTINLDCRNTGRHVKVAPFFQHKRQ